MYDGVWRDGNKLVMRRDATLPDRCVRTGRPAEGGRVDLTLYSHHPVVYAAMLGHLVLYPLLARMLGKQARVRVAMCEDALRSHRSTVAICWMLAVGGALAVLACVVLRGPSWMLLTSAAAMFAAVPIYLWGGARIVTAARIEDDHVWLSGVHPHYLATLPEWGT